jgi:hypothetical protein
LVNSFQQDIYQGIQMSPVREHYNPVITKLLREHDQLPLERVVERKSFQRQILFLMSAIKLEEFEQSFT